MDETPRWTLTVEFDPAAEIIADPYCESVLGWAADFRAYLLERWGEESEQDITLTGDTVIATGDLADYFVDPMYWVVMHVTPKRLELVRNEPR